MRILHLIQRYHPAVGGSEHFFRVVGKHLANQGHSVDVWTTNANSIEAFWARGQNCFPAGKEVVDGIPVQRFTVVVAPQHARVMRLLSNISSLKPVLHFPSPIVPGLFQRLKSSRERFDIVHMTAFPYTSLIYYGLKFARRTGAISVITPFLHLGEKPGDEVSKFYTRPDQIQLLRTADLVLVQTGSEKSYLLQQGIPEKRLCLLGMGIDPEDFPESQWEMRRERFRRKHEIEGYLVFNLTVQSRDKGSIQLIQAAQQLWEKGLGFELVLAGPRTRDFDEAFCQLPESVRQRCRVLGWVGEEEKKDLLAAGDLLVHPSRTDSFGIVFLEAWWHQLPVIGARAGGIPDVIREGVDGELTGFGSPDELASIIKDLLQDEPRRKAYGLAGRDKVIQSFTWKHKCAILQDVFECILQKGT